jgi:hypothetical protein
VVESNQVWCCCIGLSKEHIEAFIYWMIMCWSRKKSGRGKIRYRSYKPLKTEESSHGSLKSAAEQEEEDLDALLEDDDKHMQIAPADRVTSRRSWLWSFLRR